MTKLILLKYLNWKGCMADGASYHEALSNAEVIIKEWIETAKELGRPIPEAKGRLIYA